MKSPENGTTTLELPHLSVNNPNPFLLSPDQVQRAEMLGWNEDKIRDFNEIAMGSRLFLRLFYKHTQGASVFLNDFFDVLARKPDKNTSRFFSAPSEEDKKELQIILNICFTKEIFDSHILLIAPYFGDEISNMTLLRLRYLFFLFHTWHRFPELLGRLPTVEETKTQIEYADYYEIICRVYLETYSQKGAKILIPSTKDGILHHDIVILPWDIAKQSKDLLPKTFANIGAKDRFGLSDNIGAIEEMIVVGEEIPKFYEIKPAWLDGLVDRHNGRPATRDLFARIFPKFEEKFGWKYDAPITSKPRGETRKRVSATLSSPVPSVPRANPQAFYRAGKNTSERVSNSYPKPSIKPLFSKKLSQGYNISGSMSQIVTWPISSDEWILWIYIPVLGGDGEWKGYGTNDVLNLSYIRDFEYMFCYGKIDEDLDTIDRENIVTVNIRKTEAIESMLPTVSGGTSARVVNMLDAKPLVTTDNPVQSKIEDIAIGLMEVIQDNKYMCSLSGDGIVSIMFEGVGRCLYDMVHESIVWSDDSLQADADTLHELVGTDIKNLARLFFNTVRTTTLRNAKSHILNSISAFERGDESHVDTLWKNTREGELFLGGALIFDKQMIEKIIQVYRGLGLELHIYRVNSKGEPDSRGTELGLDIHFEDLFARTRSIGMSPYYSISLKIGTLPHEASILALFEGVVKNLLLLLGLSGQYKYKIAQNEGMTNTRTKPQRHSSIDIELVLTQGYRRPRIEWGRLDQATRDHIKIAIKQLDEGRAKIFYSGGFSETNGYYECSVSSRKGWNDFTEDDEVIIVDEKISSVATGVKGNDYIYDMIRSSTRLQKYMMLRIVATYLDREYDGKTPFSGDMNSYCRGFLYGLDSDIRHQFISSVTSDGGSAGVALEMKYDIGGTEKRVFDSFLEGMEDKNSKVYTISGESPYVKPAGSIPLLYSRPMTMSMSDIHTYQAEIAESKKI